MIFANLKYQNYINVFIIILLLLYCIKIQYLLRTINLNILFEIEYKNF